MKQLIDRPNTSNIKVFDKMVTELSPHMSEIEIDLIVEFMTKIDGSQYDVNPSIEDSKTQIQMIIGQQRFNDIVEVWKQKNQKLLSSFGTLKYKNKLDTSDKTLYDGLDPTDNPDDWEKVYV